MKSHVQAEKRAEVPHKTNSLQLRAAYAVCRSIARSAAKNFYYGFLALPRYKRNALCAVYAFMRQADDISDDPTLPIEERRVRLAELSERMHRVVNGQPTDDPVLLALADTSRRYNIPVELLDQLVHGTAMDLDEAIPPVIEPRPLNAPPPAVLYLTFDALYGYCYHVASVVGLACIHIFGYKDPAAERYAEQTGIAFQLTNIIRDVKEDALMGRVYLPQEDLQRFGISDVEFLNPDPVRLRPLLEFEAQRARDYYQSAQRLLPLIDEDSQPALWTLVEIYRRLLEKIAANEYNVFGDKIRLTTREKLSILARGLWRRLL
ncbi:MAG TPA: phytoene/squalene synthase family protein [Terriglobales bacterium]|nr:phytoene/squalene synthase family protein [Terriglobales bacterium]